MKVGLLTFHRAENYGAALQAYALAQQLNRMQGVEAEFIDYRCRAIERAYDFPALPKLRKEKKNWFTALRKNRLLREKKRKFESFLKERLPLGPQAVSEADKPALEERYGLIMTGSDQIFSAHHTHGVDPFYCYRKSPACRSTVVSYAASAGDIDEFIKGYAAFEKTLGAYDRLSVREKELAQVLEALVRVPVSVQADPTLLLEASEWEKLCRPYAKAPRKYLLWYDVTYNKEAGILAQRLAREKGLTLVHFDQHLAYDKKTVYAADAGPEEFLWLIRNAAFVVTSSFHGTVFSVLFEKDFVSVLPKVRGSRLKNILETIGLSARIWNGTDIGTVAPDMKAVRSKLNALREDSVRYLEECVSLARSGKKETFGAKPVPECYALIHEEARGSSQSGGAFIAFSDPVLEAGGVVYGAVLDSDFNAVHARAETKEERQKMRGSKYVQSRMGDTFKHVKQDLESGRQVLFSGTGCQVMGLKSYLGREYENLLCLELLCHGVPSKLLWQDEIKALSGGEPVKNAVFRDKSFGWHSHVESVFLENGSKKSGEVFKTLFYGHTILRPSCFHCPVKTTVPCGDLVIGDYWGLKRVLPAWEDNKGISIVIVGSKKGKQAIEALPDSIRTAKTSFTESMQRKMLVPNEEPAFREKFWQEYREKGFDYIAKKYGRGDGSSLLKKKLRSVKKTLLRLLKGAR